MVKWINRQGFRRFSVGQGFPDSTFVGQGFPLSTRHSRAEPMVLIPRLSLGTRDAEPEVSLANKGKNYKKRIRLKDFNYKGTYRYFITLCTENKRKVFLQENLVSWLIGILREKSQLFQFKVWAYCFMPEHLHLLLEGLSETSDFKKFITQFKQSTGFYYKKKYGKKLWQINYYEHVLRKEEETISIALYIFNNPVRRGLVDDYKKYKFLGSFEFGLKQT